MAKNEFDIDFDFEKEYGFDPRELLDSEDAEFNDDDFAEFRDIPSAEPAPAEDAPAVPEENFADMDLGEAFHADVNFPDISQGEFPDIPEDAFLDIPAEELFAGFEDAPVDEALDYPVDENEPVPLEDPEQPDASLPQPVISEPEQPTVLADRPKNRRKKRSKMRTFKEVYLPTIIAGVALMLILVFIIGSISGAISRNKEAEEAALAASQAAKEEAARLDQEAQDVMEKAERLAAGYDYEAAIQMLDSFSGNQADYQGMITQKASYGEMQNSLTEWRDPSVIPNLSFHVLIADPARAFTDSEFAGQYNRNFVTTDEFTKILEQLYQRGYVLVDFDSFIDENQDSLFTTPIYLPADKKPIMITETMVNYFEYMVEPDADGETGDGFARRLVLDENGDIKAEMLDANGNVVVGDYDLVPILEAFIQEHPDFSYRGARATLAVTGEEGVFGYRTNTSYINSESQAYYDEQVDGAKTIVQALRDAGYTIACFSYGNISYGADKTVAQVQTDIQNWTTQTLPILGHVDTIVYARTSDIDSYTYSAGNKFALLYDAGFRYFVSNGTAPWAEATSTYVHQDRLMVTGNAMAWYSNQFSNYFDCNIVLNSQRGSVPN